MRDAFPRAATAIVSTATYGIGEAPGHGAMELAVRASLQALGRVGLTPADVDGLFVALPQDFFAGLGLAEYLGIHPRLTNNNRVGGSSFQTYVLWAALALAAGQCDVALITYGSNQRTASGKLLSSLKPSPFEAPD